MNVLVFSSHDASLAEYLKLFSGQNIIKPIYYIAYESRIFNLLDKKNIKYIAGQVEQFNSGKRKRQSPLKTFMDDTLIGCFLQAIILKAFLSKRMIRQLEEKKYLIIDIVKKYGIEAMVVQSDRSIGIEIAALLAAKELGIKSYIMSFAYSADHQSAYKLRNSKVYRFLHGQPECVVYSDIKLGDRAFYRPFESQALSTLQILSKNPWVLGAGYVDKMLVDSQRERNRLVSLGGDAGDYLITGTKSHDDLFFLHQRALILKQQKSNKRTVLIALPQYYEHGLCDRKSHFKYIRGLLDSFKRIDVNVWVSLHPKMDPSNYDFINREYSCKILEDDIVNKIPYADLFVATYSSTVSLAILCGVRVVICDHIDLNYEDFYSEFNLTVLKDNKALRQAIIEWAEKQSSEVVYDPNLVRLLSPFDGRSSERIIGAIAEG